MSIWIADGKKIILSGRLAACRTDQFGNIPLRELEFKYKKDEI